MSQQQVDLPEGYTVITVEELDRLRSVDAKHGWKERPYVPPPRHEFVPGKGNCYWICKVCAYGPGSELKHFQRGEARPEGKAP